MKLLTTTQNVWDTPLQFGAMALLAWFHSEKTDYASVSFGYIARVCGVDRRYVKRVMEQLELEKHACVNLGPDPELGGRNRWEVTIERAVAKLRQDAGLAEDAPLARRKRRTRRRAEDLVEAAHEDAAEPAFAFSSWDPGIPGGGIPAPPPGGTGIPGGGIPGSPQSGQVYKDGDQLERRTAAAADAAAASRALEFNLVGETPAASRVAKEAKAAHAARRSRLYHRIVRQARWLLEHPAEATALNGGAPITDESGLVEATKWRCAQKRIAGYGEAGILTNACRSEWHLFKVRQGLTVTNRRELRETARTRRQARR